jgi:hypothetical protein
LRLVGHNDDKPIRFGDDGARDFKQFNRAT